MAELLDIYDENLRHLGIKPRDAVHRDGDWHRTFHCWLLCQDDAGQPALLFQKRGPDKEFHPNLLDVSAAGHYAAGETIADGVREIREELGIEISFDCLLPVGIRFAVYRESDLVDYEFNEVFLLRDDRPLAAYHPEPDEVSDLVRVRLTDGLALFAGERDCIQADGLRTGTVTLSRADFVDPPDHYTYRVLVLAQRFFNGEKHLIV